MDAQPQWIAPSHDLVCEDRPMRFGDTFHEYRSTRSGPVDLDWLFGMWGGHTVDWFVQWPILGHGQAHVGEAIAVRHRMGLSPY